MDGDFKALVRRRAEEIRTRQKVDTDAARREEERKSDFILAYREAMRDIAKPVLEDVHTDLDAAGVQSTVSHSESGDTSLAVRLNLTSEARVAYSTPYNTYRSIRVEISAGKETETGTLEPHQITEELVQRHVAAMLRLAEGKPVASTWASGVG